MQNMELIFQNRHQSEVTRLRTTLVEDGEPNKAEALDFLGLRYNFLMKQKNHCMQLFPTKCVR